MKDNAKKVWKYITISLLLLLGLFCIGILYLFFIPNATLFNITYINNNDKIKSESFASSAVDEIVFNSRAFEVNVLPSEDENISVLMNSNSFGFVLTKNSTSSVSANLKDKVLTFNITETHGFAFRNGSYVNLYLPTSKSFNLKLNNTKATTSIKSADLKINNLSYTTKDGDFNFTAGSLSGNLDLNLSKSKFTIHEAVATSSNNVNINVTSGKFYAESETLGDVKILQNERGVVSIGACNRIDSNVATSGGQIYLNKVNIINVNTSDTIITVDEVAQNATITLTKSGTVDITTLSGTLSTISTDSGHINISNANSILSLSSESGNITVNNATLRISVKSNYGDVNIHFKDDAESYATNIAAKVLYANIHNGKLTATGVEHIGKTSESTESSIAGITVSGKGRIVLSMNNVLGENSISGNNGSIHVTIKEKVTETDYVDYILTTSTSSGNVRVNLTQIPEYNGYTTKTQRTTNVNCTTSANTLSVTTNQGDLTILDSNFA